MDAPPPDPLLSLPGYVLRRASAAMMAELALRLAPLDLRNVEATILLSLAAHPGMSQSALGRKLGIKRANMTPLAARLEARGLIRRRAQDGRTLGLELTEAGTSLASEVSKATNAHEQALMDRIPARHRPHLLPALQALWSEAEGD